jgi:GDPmannose 4,6-dehydratase
MHGKARVDHGYYGPGWILSYGIPSKGYEVHGIKRRSSSFNTERIDHLYHDWHEANICLVLHYGDLTDGSSLRAVISQVQPDEIYNLGAQCDVRISFDQPVYTVETDALGTLIMLEAIRDACPKVVLD